MNKQMNSTRSFASSWEMRVLGLSNRMLDIKIYLLQLEINVIQELVKSSPTPELVTRLGIKESSLNELATKSIRYD